MRSSFRIINLIVTLLAIPLIGTLGFMAIEGWGALDSLYMAVITLSTVGFNEIHPLSGSGRVFVIVYLLLCLGVFVYGVSQVGEMIIRGQLLEFLGSRRMNTALKSIKGHIVVCGFGRMGQKLCRRLAAGGKPFLVVDRDSQVLARAESEGWPFIAGDATDDKTLLAAGVERATGLAAVLSSDADNLYVVLSARLIQPKLLILARSADEKSIEKMKRAGANRIINIYEAGAHKMARLLSNRNLENFIELLSTSDSEFDIAQFTVSQGAEYCGKTLEDSGFRERDIMIVCISKQGQKAQIPPPSSVPINAGDTLIAIGKSSDLTALLQPE